MIGVTMTLELSKQINYAITYFTCSRISWHWKLLFENRSQELFSPIAASMSEKFRQNLYSIIKLFGDEVFVVRNVYTVKTGQSWRSAIIFIKQSAFAMQFYLIGISILFKNVSERSWRQIAKPYQATLNCLLKKMVLDC